MQRILIFGNSGSGKSTLAAALCARHGLAHLDLDTLAWEATQPPRRRPLPASARELARFTDSHAGWVVEGCYADLLALLLPEAGELIFLDLPVEACVENARRRPWEPHKYASPEAQDANLAMLLDWIRRYPDRTDEFSRGAHLALYQQFPGPRQRLTGNPETTAASRRNGD